MKKILLILCVGLFCCTYQAKSQWVVTDPSNLVQSIINVGKATTTASNMLKTVQESVKIYEQGKKYYDALKSVSNIIKDARKVQETVAMVGEMTNIYVRGFEKMLADPNFSVAELAAIGEGYAKLLAEGANVVSDLKSAVTANGLSMSDKDRMDLVDLAHRRMKEYRNLTLYYTNKNISVSYLRSKKKNDTKRIQALYGNPSERYW